MNQSLHDRVFLKNFAFVLAGLIVFALGILGLSLVLHSRADYYEMPEAKREATLQRLEPVGKVNTGEQGAVVVPQTTAASIAFDGSLDAAYIYEQACQSCHDAGLAGAPKLEVAAWEGRMDQGMETLVAHAVNGYQGELGYMPAKGGRSDLSEEQVAITVEWMIDNLE